MQSKTTSAKPRRKTPKKNKKKKRGSSNRTLRIVLCIIISVIIIAGAYAINLYNSACTVYDGEDSYTLIIPKDATKEQIADSLSLLPDNYGNKVYRMWKLRDGQPHKAAGVYVITPGDKVWSVAGRIATGLSSSVKVTFNNVRLMSDLASRLSRYFLWTDKDFLEACQSVLSDKGYKAEEYPAVFLPDTYEFYASAMPSEVVEKLLFYHDRFWNEERTAKAAALGLTPLEVATLASIVEEESNNSAERPVIARLYLNRLHKGMRLQADPTVKFGIGDFSIRRLSSQHLKHVSPYNTYLVSGLPPGPIRIPEAKTIDAVLNAPNHDYLYMCAKPDNSHTHNFTNSYEKHLRNAAAYRKWLDDRGITL